MGILSELDRISGIRIFTYSFIIASLFLPSFLLVFLFRRDLFITLDTLKLLLLCVAISFPVMFIGLLLSSISNMTTELKTGEISSKEQFGFQVILLMCLFSNGIFFATFLGRMFLRLNLISAIADMALVAAFFLVVEIVEFACVRIRKGKKA